MTQTRRSTAEVGRLYDELQAVVDEFGDGQFHLWYWYDEQDDDASIEEAMRRITRKAADGLGLRPGEHVLDAGCGVGESAFLLAREAGVRVTGVTISREQVGQACRSASANGMAGQVRFEFADYMALPFADGMFDAVLAIEALSYAPDLPEAFGELARVLRPGGRITFTDFSLEKPMDAEQMARFVAPLSLNEPLTLQQWTAALAAAGLVVEEYTQCGRRVGGRQAKYRAIEAARRERVAEAVGADVAADAADRTAGFFAAMPEHVGYLIVSARKPR